MEVNVNKHCGGHGGMLPRCHFKRTFCEAYIQCTASGCGAGGHPWCSRGGRGITFRLSLLTVGLSSTVSFAFELPIGQAGPLTGQHCTLRQPLMDAVTLSPLTGVNPAYWPTDTPSPPAHLLPLLLPFALHRHFPNPLHVYFFLCLCSSQAQTDLSI